MRIKPDVGSVVGPSDQIHWGQAILSPTAYGVVELETSDARRDGITLLTQLGDRLKEPPVSLGELRRLIQELTHAGTKSIAILVPVGSIIYIALSGKGAIYLKRGEAISCLLNAAGALSGELKEGDTIILASEALIQAVSEQTLMSVFDHSGARDVAEKLTLFLHEAGSPLGSAALIFQAAEFIPTEQEETHVAVPTVVAKEIPKVTTWRVPKQLILRLEELKFLLHPRIRRHLAPIKPYLHEKKRSIPFVAATLVGLFVVSVIFGIMRKSQTATNQHVTNTLSQAQHDFDEGVALSSLNPVKGRERLTEAKTLLEPLTKSLSPKSGQGRDVASLYQKVVDNLSVAMHIARGDPTIFFDPGLLKKGGQASSIGLFEDTLGILDSTNNSVYTVTVSAKSGVIVGGGNAISGGTRVAVYGNKLYVLTPEGIALVHAATQQTTPAFVGASAQWGNIGALVGYTGNLYLLDIQKSRVWKYMATDTGFSELREYLNPDTLPDFSHATGMAIDGSVWVGTSDGKILRFTQGAENTFSPQGVDPALGKYLMVYTSDDAKNVYVLDLDNKRVVVLDKDGIYLAQYIWQMNFQPTQMVVSETAKKIVFLASGKIYALDIK
ncbi:hypothetical protein HY031_02865 [Candidatus Gottesmanbacteria bacterium]|nr:hypothetical protein [Candidatus Gottesmanbacteria bacterium]